MSTFYDIPVEVLALVLGPTALIIIAAVVAAVLAERNGKK